MAARGDETVNKAKGPWIHRFMIYFFTVVLAVLVFWVLGFLVEDIGAIRGPQYTEIEQRYVDQDLVDRAKTLMAEITDVDRAISDKREEMRIVNDSSQNLQNTINQLIELQKLAVQRSVSLSDKEQTNLSESLAHFLESQKRYQVYNTELSRLTDRKRSLESERSAIEKKIAGQSLPAGEEFRVLREKHDLRLAGYQLLILLPMLAAGAIFVVRKRGSVYFPLFLGYLAPAAALHIRPVNREKTPRVPCHWLSPPCCHRCAEGAASTRQDFKAVSLTEAYKLFPVGLFQEKVLRNGRVQSETSQFPAQEGRVPIPFQSSPEGLLHGTDTPVKRFQVSETFHQGSCGDRADPWNPGNVVRPVSHQGLVLCHMAGFKAEGVPEEGGVHPGEGIPARRPHDCYVAFAQRLEQVLVGGHDDHTLASLGLPYGSCGYHIIGFKGTVGEDLDPQRAGEVHH